MVYTLFKYNCHILKIDGNALNFNTFEFIGNGKYKDIPEICDIKTTDFANCLGIYVGHNKNLSKKKTGMK